MGTATNHSISHTLPPQWEGESGRKQAAQPSTTPTKGLVVITVFQCGRRGYCIDTVLGLLRRVELLVLSELAGCSLQQKQQVGHPALLVMSGTRKIIPTKHLHLDKYLNSTPLRTWLQQLSLLYKLSMRRPNEVMSFMSSHEVLVNNLSMVHDRLHCVSCLSDYFKV